MMLELSPLDTAANAPARSIPASMSTLRSKPPPITCWPWKSPPSLRNACASLSITATEWPRRSTAAASDDPTRPQPMITTCTTWPPRCQQSVKWPADAEPTGGCSVPVTGPPTLPVRAQARVRAEAAGRGTSVPHRPPCTHAPAQTYRPAGVRLRRDVQRRLRAGGDPDHAVGGRRRWLRLQPVDRAHGRRADGRRRGLLPAE